MASQIDGTLPIAGSPTTLSVRTNFGHARDELSCYLRTSKDFATTSGTSTAYVVDFGVAAAKVAGERVTALFHVANGVTQQSTLILLAHHLLKFLVVKP